jgi:D-glycero-D-manno-heptose 1,7-bisphosphate phosphatase
MPDRRPALFLDRDGVLNVDHGYVARVEHFEWIEGARECVANFNRRGWYVFVVTNQSGIARGLYTEDDMQTLHTHMLEELEEAGAHIDRLYYAPWHEAGEISQYRRQSIDRKPGPGMLLRAMADFPVNREQSFLIGDKQSDMEAARAAGVGAFLFRGGNLATFAEWSLASFEDGVRG